MLFKFFLVYILLTNCGYILFICFDKLRKIMEKDKTLEPTSAFKPFSAFDAQV